MNLKNVVKLGLSLVALSGLTMCVPIDEDDWDEDAAVQEPEAEVAGRWTVSGKGTLYDCPDETHSESEVNLNITAFTVTQNGSALTASIPASSALRFANGSVHGQDVSFNLSETWDNGGIDLRFYGEANQINEIRGDYDGVGPFGCKHSGEFWVSVDNR